MKNEFCKSISSTRDQSRTMEFVSGGKTETALLTAVTSCYVFLFLVLPFFFHFILILFGAVPFLYGPTTEIERLVLA